MVLLLLYILGQVVADHHDTCTNVALSGLAVSNVFDKPPKRAIDGNTAGKMIMKSVYASKQAQNAKWGVLLPGGEVGVEYPVNAVTIWPRKDKDTELISGAKVWVGEKMCGEVQYSSSKYTAVEVKCGNGTRGGAVFVEHSSNKLELAEVQVWVHTNMMPTLPAYTNVALDKPTKMSRQFQQHKAARAVDGNKNKWLGGQSCASTKLAQQKWWRVDLQDTFNITSVRIHNRIDAPIGLNDAKVYVVDGDVKQLCGVIQVSPRDVPVYTLQCALRGSRVVVSGSQGNKAALTLCEVQVFVVEEEEGTEVVDEEEM